MQTVLETIIHEIREARAAATLERAGFGFPNDRIEVKSVHFGDDRTGRVGDVIHPTDYVRKITELHHGSWIIGPLDRAIALLTLHADLINQAAALAKALEHANVEKLADLTAAARKNHF